MCSTCNHKNYTEKVKTINDKPFTFLQNENCPLDIKCDVEGRNFKVGEFKIYHCPTCGRKLY